MNRKSSELLDKIKKEFPSLEWKNVKFTDMNWDFDVAILDKKYIFRFPRSANCRRKFKIEIRLLKYLNKKISLPIPDYTYITKDFSFAGYNMINGVGVSKERYKKLDVKEKDLMAMKLAIFLNELHSTPLSVAKKYGIEEESYPQSHKKFELEVHKYLLPKFNRQEKISVHKFLKNLGTIYPIKNKVLTHGDLARENFLIADGKISGVIDFTDMSINDPAVDFNDLWDYGEKFVKKVYAEYKSKRDDGLVSRSKLYYKKNSLRLMIIALKYKASPLPYNDAYKLFKEIFYM
jgi:aminoglycoside phosphotransferase (APT) family kinase protein